MLPEAGATELIFLAAVALIVVGPKDLPVLMRKVGQWVAKMRGLAAEFRSSFDELARQSELDELRKEVEALRNTRIPDPLTNLHPGFDDASAGFDPAGLSIAEGYHPGGGLAPALDPHATPAAVEPVPPTESAAAEKPAMRTTRKPKAAASDDPAPAAKPRRTARPKTGEAGTSETKPRTRRASPPAEAEG